MVVSQEVFGKTESREEVIKYSIKNSNGLELDVISFGATLVSLKCPDRNGKIDDVVLGFDNLEDYLTNAPYFGSTIGRVANRIANGKFSLGGKEYQLAINAPPNSHHGGPLGFHKHNWKGVVMGDRKVKFTYISPDGDENYPGELTACVTFTLTDNNEVELDYEATTKAETIVNLTSHGFFNLAGQVDRDVLDHIALINAPTFLPTNDAQIPTGEKCLVSSPNSAFDFTTPKPIGQDIDKVPGGGYDHTYCLPQSKGFRAEVYHPPSGRVIKMFTDQPGVHFYTSNYLDGSPGKGGVPYPKHGAFCLEAQNFPDAINQPDFPSPILHPGETYKQKTIYKFDVK